MAPALVILGGGVFFAADARAQDLQIPKVTFPSLPRHGATAEAFVPSGWAIESQATGDLNRDGRPDRVIVLRQRDSKNIISNDDGLGENPFDTNPRILAVVFATPSSGYILQVDNHRLIPRREDPVLDDPLSETGGIAIERGTLRVRLHSFASAGSWAMGSTAFTFQSRNGRFELIGYDRDTVARNTGETTSVSVNYLTRKMKLTRGTIESDAARVTWKTLPARRPPTIDQIGDGFAFDPER